MQCVVMVDSSDWLNAWQEAEKQLMNALAEIFDNPVSVRVYPSFAAASTTQPPTQLPAPTHSAACTHPLSCLHPHTQLLGSGCEQMVL